MKLFMDALEKNQGIHTVKFIDIVIHEKEANCISEMLKTKASIQKLEIVNCGLHDAAVTQISQGVGLSKQLKYLDLRNNYFEAQGLSKLTNALRNTSSVQTLLLEDIECEDISSLADLFSDANCKIAHLALNSL